MSPTGFYLFEMFVPQRVGWGEWNFKRWDLTGGSRLLKGGLGKFYPPSAPKLLLPGPLWCEGPPAQDGKLGLTHPFLITMD